MPQAAAHRGGASVANGQNFREVGLHQCPSERRGEEVPVRSLRVPSHVPSHPQTAAKVRGFSPTASGFAAETDCLLEESRFELMVPPRTERNPCRRDRPDSLQSASRATVDKFGRLDVLHNNAGGSTAQDDTAVNAPLDEFWRAIKLDLYGTFLGCRFGIPELMKAGGGSVINKSSNLALMGGHRSRLLHRGK